MSEGYKQFKSFNWTSKEKGKESAKFHIIAEFADMKTESAAEMTSLKINKQGTWGTISGPNTNIVSAVLSPRERMRTKTKFSMDYQLPYSIFGKLIDKLRFHKAIEKSFDVSYQETHREIGSDKNVPSS
jgi:hypothetical protein